MDASNSTHRSIDFITENVSVPLEMTREDHADLFDAVNALIAPYLSHIDLEPVEQIKYRVFPQHVNELLGEEFQGALMALVYQTERANDRILANQFIHEVYLTEKGQWIVVATWRDGKDATRIIRNREDFLSYYDEIHSDNLPHPSAWLVEGPRTFVSQAIEAVEFYLGSLRELEESLSGYTRRYKMVVGSTAKPTMFV